MFLFLFFVLQLWTTWTDIQDRQITEKVHWLMFFFSVYTCDRKFYVSYTAVIFFASNIIHVWLHQVWNPDDIHGTSWGGGGEVSSLLRHQGSSREGRTSARRRWTGREDQEGWEGDPVRILCRSTKHLISPSRIQFIVMQTRDEN